MCRYCVTATCFLGLALVLGCNPFKAASVISNEVMQPETDFDFRGISLGDSLSEAAKSMGAHRYTSAKIIESDGIRFCMAHISLDGSTVGYDADEQIRVSVSAVSGSDKISAISFVFVGIPKQDAIRISSQKLGGDYNKIEESGENAFGVTLTQAKYTWRLKGGGNCVLMVPALDDCMLSAKLPEYGDALNAREKQKDSALQNSL